MAGISTFSAAGALDFAPAILRAQHENAPPLPRRRGRPHKPAVDAVRVNE
jgi:hypothetical protein